MANKKIVLTLGENRQNNYKGWSDYTVGQLEEIDSKYNKNEDSLQKAVTSIPSPFARMDLVKQAFQYYVDMHEGKTKEKDFNKKCFWLETLSAALDVGEIFFNYDSLKDKVEIVSWGKKEYEALHNAGNKKAVMFSDSIKTFMGKKLEPVIDNVNNKIYILRFTGNYKQKQYYGFPVIGATSTETFFFAACEINEDIANQITFPYNKDKPFDPQYKHLWERDPNFIRYIYWLCLQKNNGVDDSVSKYVQDVLINHLPEDNFKKQLLSMQSDENLDASVQDIFIGNEKVQFVSGIPLKQNSNPLEDNLFKCGDLFRAGTGENPEYDYYTLADANFKTIYQKGNEEYNDALKKLAHYLIPLKPIFIKKYGIKDIKSHLTVEPNINFTQIQVYLEAHNCKYLKRYATIDNSIIDLDSDFVNILPHIKFADEKYADYRVFLHSSELKDTKVKFYVNNSSKELDDIDIIDSEPDKMRVHSFKKNFDYIQITRNGASNIIYPKPEQMPVNKEGGKEYIFAVDLGTSNTHIAYADNEREDSEIKSFDISNEDLMIKPTQSLWEGHKNSIKENLMPMYLGNATLHRGNVEEKIVKESTASFPIRTALANWNKKYTLAESKAFENANIAFFCNKVTTSKEHELIYNIKWNSKAVQALRTFINNILFLIKNKVLQMGGDLQKTKLIWFYPTSMNLDIRNRLENNWKHEYKNIFGGDPDKNVKNYSESVAPVRANKNSADKTISIDIGGGTTDFYYNEGEERFISSVRFASDDIFRSNSKNEPNGIIKGQIDKMNEEKNSWSSHTEFAELYNSVYGSKKELSDEDCVKLSYFFLGINDLSDEMLGDALKQSLSLQSTQYTHVAYFFYLSLIYYAAQLIKKYNIANDKEFFPEKIIFSGNGAKNLSCLVHHIKDVRQVSTKIFSKVLQEDKNTDKSTDIDVVLNVDRPKELTAEGGIQISKIKDPASAKKYSEVGRADEYYWFAALKDEDSKSNDYQGEIKLDVCDKQIVVANVLNFTSIIDDILGNNKNSEISRDLKNLLEDKKYIAQEKWSGTVADKIQEYKEQGLKTLSSSLFFEPVKYILHQLSQAAPKR